MKRMVLIKLLSAFIVVMLLVAGGVGAYAYKTLKDIQKNPLAAFNGEKDPDEMKVVVKDESGKEVEKTFQYNDDIVNLVLLGLDSDEQREKASMGYRSDTIIVAAINMKTKQVTMITVPRDTRTMVKKLDKDGKVTSEGINKINAAFAFGRGRNKYSYPNALDAIGKLLGNVPLQHYAGIDMDGIGPLADAVGGVPLKVDVNIPEAGLVKGKTQVLKGEMAKAYVRERHIAGTGGSDVERTKRQQRFVKAFLARIKELGPVEAVPKLYNKTQKYVDTNLNMEQMAAFALVLRDMDLDTIKITSVPGRAQMISGVSYWVADEEALKQIVAETFYTMK